MKTKIALITMLGSFLLLSGCSDWCGGCGGCGYAYNSTCGYPSCTETTCIADNSSCCDNNY